jgi:hypothetical protein
MEADPLAEATQRIVRRENIIMHREWVSIWKNAFVTYFKVLGWIALFQDKVIPLGDLQKRSWFETILK